MIGCSFTSAMVAMGAGAPPVALTAPTISGNAVIGETLTGTDGTYSSATAVTVGGYQWQRSPTGTSGWANIPGATSADYTLVHDDHLKFLRRGEVATNSARPADRAYSLASEKITADIVFVGVAYAVSSTAGSSTIDVSLSSLSVGIGGPILENDIAITISHSVNQASATNLDMQAVADGTGANYSELLDLNYGPSTNYENFGIHYRVQGSTPDASVRLTRSAATDVAVVAAALVYRYVDTVNPFDVAVQSDVRASNTGGPNPPAVTPETAGAIVLAIGASASSFQTERDLVIPSGFTEIKKLHVAKFYSAYNPFAMLAIAYKNWASGAVDPGEFTSGGGGAGHVSVGATVVLRPAT